jgi:hypothetical protein
MASNNILIAVLSSFFQELTFQFITLILFAEVLETSLKLIGVLAVGFK